MAVKNQIEVIAQRLRRWQPPPLTQINAPSSEASNIPYVALQFDCLSDRGEFHESAENIGPSEEPWEP